ncbi:CaiB/BaiF CoA transferase family protein [Halarsenatibacter silvermanii]|uniref:CoA:oxalate CoA-transferase n=1 Tax=Halarsenatibacter silvermanii TaxID=321763 RepID=A0A1G9PVX1_9FIRM|nr:CaiB/BaiF CoA-transferase family protein [Halarsenatibacter silvermanii]SDM02916.1 CoA:oxalate CoA-transferase [Halarsenatibacter silvermanii]
MKALDDIRVIDLSHVLAAPFCTMMLADMGAEVIKIEPPSGDDSREFGPFFEPDEKGDEQSGYFVSLNRNKKSTSINLKTEEGKEILRKLIAGADVVVENFRPNTMKKLGFSYEEIKEIKSDIIYCSICGFGHDALPEYATKPAYDMVAQAYSGLMSITGPKGGPPCRVGTSVGDIVAGHQAAIGILSALWHREKTGEGQHVDISMVDGLVSILENAISRYTIKGEVPEPLGTAHPNIAPFQSFPTKDDYIITPIGNDGLWEKFCEAIGKEELVDHPKFKDNRLRCENLDELVSRLEEVMKTKTTEEWIEIFEESGLPYSPLNRIDDVVDDDNINYRNMIEEVEQPDLGKVEVTGSPFKLSKTPGEVETHAPKLGEHNEEVLTELLDYSQQEVEKLKENEVLNEPK